MQSNNIIIGTRSSELAIWQANLVKEKIERKVPNISIELRLIKTRGDKIQQKALDQISGSGLFTKEIEKKLLDGEIDLAVHSLKDLETTLPEGLTIGGVVERGPVEDVLAAKQKGITIENLSDNATVATGSIRRKAQLLHIRPDLNIIGLRGNVNTRIRKLEESNWEAAVFARAGLTRVNLDKYISSVIDTDVIIPSVGQGALAVEFRENEYALRDILAKINHKDTELAVKAERAFLKRLGGGCKTPIAAYSHIENGKQTIDGVVASVNGEEYLREKITSDSRKAEELGEELAETLLSRGAEDIIKKYK